MSRTNPWKAAAPIIRRRLFKNNDAYLVIDRHGLGSTWLQGGCWVAAEAIRRVFGGLLVGVYSGRGLEHVAVYKHGWVIDAEGVAGTETQYARRYGRVEHLGPCTILPFSEAHARQRHILFDESAVRQTVELLQ